MAALIDGWWLEAQARPPASTLRGSSGKLPDLSAPLHEPGRNPATIGDLRDADTVVEDGIARRIRGHLHQERP
jgi:hypothetical protein